MKLRAKIGKKILNAITTVLLFIFCFYGAAYSQQGEPESGVGSISPVPAFHAGEFDLEGSAEKLFQVIGTVDFIGDEHIVVNDASIRLAPGYRPSRSFEGQFVGLRLNSNGKVHYVQRLKKRKIGR